MYICLWVILNVKQCLFEGWKCEKCKPEHYGDPSLFNCKPCECDAIGSVSKQCDNVTGSCECKDKFIGRTCDQCQVSKK